MLSLKLRSFGQFRLSLTRHFVRYYVKPLKGPKPVLSRINEQISEPSVILIDLQGVNQGLHATSDILAKLDRLKYELKEVGKYDEHIVCKIGMRPPSIVSDVETPLMSMKAGMEEKDKVHVIKFKELVFRASISPHDLSYRLDQLKEFLRKGYHVRIQIRGKEAPDCREGQHPSKKALYDKIWDSVKSYCKLKAPPKYMPTLFDATLIGEERSDGQNA
jgi:translation initiation factor IF-3